MGLSKTEAFNAQQNRIAGYAKALAHPARIAIVEYLIQQKSCICGDLVEVLPLSQSTVSQHLKELKKSGLIKGSIEAPRVCYCIDEAAWAEAQQVFGRLFASLAPVNACC